MTLVQSVKSVYSKYACFHGRASRSEYWFFILVYCVIYGVLLAIVWPYTQAGAVNTLYFWLPMIWSLINIIPMVAVVARRLHDIDKSGWWQLIALIPLVGWIITIIWYCTKGQEGDNRFGPDPLL